MPLALNPLVVDTGTPPIPEATAWLARYDLSRGPAIDLAQAVPGDPPPPDMRAALAEAAGSAEAARYGPILGDAALRAAHAAELSATYCGAIEAEDIVVTAGCNLAFVVAVLALAKAGDAVLLPAPWYFNHEMALNMLGVAVQPLPCRAAARFVPDPDEAEALIDARTRAIVLVTPNNPTGAVYPVDVIDRFSDLARRRGLFLVLDETYRDLLPDGVTRAHDLFAQPSAAWDHVVQLYSFSKAYSIPGHRLGAMVAPRAAREALIKVLDTFQICAPRTPQIAATWAIPALAAHRARNRAEIARRAQAFRSAFAGLQWRIGSVGAYFAYVEHPFADVPGADVAQRLAETRGVLALPGSYFGPGQERHLRFAFANAGVDVIDELPARLRGFTI